MPGLVAEVEQDGTRFKKAERFALRTVWVKDCGDVAVGIEGQKFAGPGLVLADVDEVGS